MNFVKGRFVMPKITLDLPDKIYEALNNSISSTQYQSVEEYLYSVLAVLPLKKIHGQTHALTNAENQKQVIAREIRANDPEVDKLLGLMEEYNVRQKDLASVLMVSEPAISAQIKTTTPYSKTKLRRFLNKRGVEGVFIEAFLNKLKQDGHKAFLDSELAPQIPLSDIMCIIHGYALWASSDTILEPTVFYNRLIDIDKHGLELELLYSYLTEGRESLEKLIDELDQITYSVLNH